MSQETIKDAEQFVLNSLVRRALNTKKVLDGYQGKTLRDSKAIRGVVEAYNWRVSMIEPNASDEYLYQVVETDEGIQVRKGK